MSCKVLVLLLLLAQAADAERARTSLGEPTWLKKGLQVCKGKCNGANSGIITVVGLAGWSRPWKIVWQIGEPSEVPVMSEKGWKGVVRQVPGEYVEATDAMRVPEGMQAVFIDNKKYFAPKLPRRGSVKPGSYTYNPGATKQFAEKCFRGVGKACKQTGACTVYCMAKPLSVLKKTEGTQEEIAAECSDVCQGAESPCNAAFEAFKADYAIAAATVKFSPDAKTEEADVELHKQQFVSKGLLRKRTNSNTYDLMALMADQAAACHYEKLFKRQAFGSTGRWCIDAKTPTWQKKILPEFKKALGLSADASTPDDTWQHGDNCEQFLTEE